VGRKNYTKCRDLASSRRYIKDLLHGVGTMKALMIMLLAAFCIGWVSRAEYEVRETLYSNIVNVPSPTPESPSITVLPDVKTPGLEMKGNILVEGPASKLCDPFGHNVYPCFSNHNYSERELHEKLDGDPRIYENSGNVICFGPDVSHPDRSCPNGWPLDSEDEKK
jgi:hypothetical protein